jgi:hypothetical protein
MNTSSGHWRPVDNFPRPSFTVRVDILKEINPYHIPGTERADNAYHGGDIDDEIAAMTSLILGIRTRPGHGPENLISIQIPVGIQSLEASKVSVSRSH